MFTNLWKGALIGIASVIPGVSGGTLALILGVYEKLTEAIGEFFQCTLNKRKKYIKFLGQILAGVIIGILLFSKAINFLFINHYEGTSFLFLGLIVASLPSIIGHRKKVSPSRKEIVLFLIGGIVPLMFFFYNIHFGNVVQPLMAIDITFIYMIKLMFCGIMAGAAMVIPGISGSLLLILLGEYSNIVRFVSDLRLVPITAIAIGSIFGILLFAKIMDRLLKKYHDETLYFVLGIVISSLVEVWPGMTLELLNIMRNIFIFGIGVILVNSIKKIN